MNRAAALRAAGALLLGGLGSCAGLYRWPWGSTQRWPGPMESLADPLPPGDAQLYPPGPEDVLVVRHADPVQVRPAGLTSAFPLNFYTKTLKTSSGSTVYCAPGGRLEVVWPSGNSVTIHGRGAGVVGSPSRGEPGFLFREIERATVDLREEEQVELIGGARLEASSGPFVIAHFRPDILRVKNQSKQSGRIAFREERFVLDPGQVIDLPLLSSGGKPTTAQEELEPLRGPGFDVERGGALEELERPGAVGLRALGEHEVRGLGVRVRLNPGEEVWFEGLGRPDPASKAPPTGATTPPAGKTTPPAPPATAPAGAAPPPAGTQVPAPVPSGPPAPVPGDTKPPDGDEPPAGETPATEEVPPRAPRIPSGAAPRRAAR